MAENMVPVVINATAFISAQYKQVLAGVKAAAGKAGKIAHVFTEDGFDALDTGKWPPVMIATGTSLPFLRRVIHRMEREGRRVVLAGTDSEPFGSSVSCATHSRRAEMMQVAQYLWRHGRRRIALVGFDEHSINDRFRYQAALAAQEGLGIPLNQENAFIWAHDPEACFQAFAQKRERYDAAICPNDVIAVSFSNFCRKIGVRVPEELFIASFGGMQLSRFARPSVTTTTMDDFQVGQQAVAVWHFLRENYGTGMAMKISVPSHIIPRASTAFLPDDASAAHAAVHEPADMFYSIPRIAALVRLDDCLVRRDALDLKILDRLMAGDSYEAICDALFISGSALRYRLHKIYEDAGAPSRAAFERLIREQLGGGNPFGGEAME